MFIFENLIIMYSSPIMTCFVQYSPITIDHVLCLHSMFLLFTGVVTLPSSLVLWPWYFLFSRIYESLETRKVLFNFIYSSKLSSTFIQFLWQWDTPFDKWFYKHCSGQDPPLYTPYITLRRSFVPSGIALSSSFLEFFSSF